MWGSSVNFVNVMDTFHAVLQSHNADSRMSHKQILLLLNAPPLTSSTVLLPLISFPAEQPPLGDFHEKQIRHRGKREKCEISRRKGNEAQDPCKRRER
jgi:hypothetical protein